MCFKQFLISSDFSFLRSCKKALVCEFFFPENWGTITMLRWLVRPRNPRRVAEELQCFQILVARAIRNAIPRTDSRESFAIKTPIFIALQADSPESLDFPIRANRANRFVRITPLSFRLFLPNIWLGPIISQSCGSARTLFGALWKCRGFFVKCLAPISPGN